MKLPAEPDPSIARIPILVLPGLSGSGPEHWQSLWEREKPNFRRIEQEDWYKPDPQRWIDGIERAVDECREDPIVVAHSLGCVALAHWAAYAGGGRICAAMLVAPPDGDRKDFPHDISAFAPLPRNKLPFPSVLVASSNDPWCSIERAEWIAEVWESEFVGAGPCGHINVAAGFGPWPGGEAALNRLIESVLAARGNSSSLRSSG